MKFYPTINKDGKVQLVATQLQAKAAGVKKPEPINVPTDSEGLMKHLNELMLQIDPLAPHVVPEREEKQEQVENEPELSQAWPEGLARPDNKWGATSILADMARLKQDRVKYKIVADDVADFIRGVDSYHLPSLFSAIIERMEKAKKELG